MNIRLWLLGSLLLAFPSSVLAMDTSARPNLLLIFADDLGYGDSGCYGSKLVPTPAIDSLARDGVRCTDGYVTAPVCAPSRCGLLSGAYNQRFGMQWNDDRRRYTFGEHQLLPQALRAAGYVTGHIGKWNVPVDVKACFDEVYDLIDWEADYFPDADGHYHGVDSETEFASSKVQGVWGPERPDDEYLTDRLGRHAVEFIDKHKQGDRPFFLYLAFNAVHTPLHAKQQDAARFGELPIPLNFYASMVASMDENIGRVLDALPENTLVAFTSDNGPARMPVEKWPDGWPTGVLAGSAGPLNGHKGQFLEGGIREPFLLRWPGKIEAGSVYSQPISTMDLYPTFCCRGRRCDPLRHASGRRRLVALPDGRERRSAARDPLLEERRQRCGSQRRLETGHQPTAARTATLPPGRRHRRTARPGCRPAGLGEAASPSLARLERHLAAARQYRRPTAGRQTSARSRRPVHTQGQGQERPPGPPGIPGRPSRCQGS
jgi:arylsulfatase A-like enzyme